MNKLLLFIFFISCSNLYSQHSVEEAKTFDYYLELISELNKSDDETDFNDLAYELYDLWESPVNINTASPYDFARLFWLSEFQLTNLIEYVQKQKPIISIYELVFVQGFDTTLVSSLKPFITISRSEPNFRSRSKSWLMLRMGKTLEDQKGYRDKKFEGDAWKSNIRYKYQFGEKVYAGINLEKDAGEAFFKGSNRAGPDFYSGYLRINNLGLVKNLSIGNFSIGTGQGLVAGAGFALGKSSQAINLIQKESGIRPYSSNDENRFLQGIATTLEYKPVELSLFLSYKKIDANVSRRDSDDIKEVSSLQTAGYHNTEGEITDEDALSELTAGGRLLLRKSKFQLGVSFIYTKFDANIVPRPAVYNQFYFRGNEQTNLGFDYKVNFSNTIVFGEEAIDKNGNSAFLNGITSNIGSRIQLSLLHRYYSRAYHSFYGNAFGENTRVQNEEGLYGGIRMEIVSNINLSFYADYFRFPWLKFGVDAPSFGREFLIQTEYNPSADFTAYLQYRYKLKQTNSLDSLEISNRIVSSESNRVRLHLSYQIIKGLNLSSRIEIGTYGVEGKSSENSYLVYQDLRYVFNKLPLQISMRYARFDTDSYDSRIYAYENDVLYAFSVNSFYMKGKRYYALLKYSPIKMMDIWVKYSRSLYPGEDIIGSGLYQIEGNSRSDIRMQVILKF